MICEKSAIAITAIISLPMFMFSPLLSFHLAIRKSHAYKRGKSLFLNISTCSSPTYATSGKCNGRIANETAYQAFSAHCIFQWNSGSDTESTLSSSFFIQQSPTQTPPSDESVLLTLIYIIPNTKAEALLI